MFRGLVVHFFALDLKADTATRFEQKIEKALDGRKRAAGSVRAEFEAEAAYTAEDMSRASAGRPD